MSEHCYLTSLPFMVIPMKAGHKIFGHVIALNFRRMLPKLPAMIEQFESACNEIKDRSGPVMGFIQQFSDFHLLHITPQNRCLC